MNPKCHRCTKTVYPVEKLNCLDKYWHKGCFNCETCHMTLSMKTYKGYKKLPYCNTHYPTTSFTAVADTPENMRIKKNTTNQSAVSYHKDFEKEKGKFTAVADDPETLRIKKTQQQASDLAYQKDLVEQRGKVTQVADDPETLRNKRTQQQSSNIAYQQKMPEQAPSTRYGADPSEPPSQPEPRYEPEPTPAPADPPASNVGNYEALYDYAAADEDEVSFQEGDIIINGEIIDEGWMTGTVKRSGEHGMLPSNYVEACK